VARSQSRLQRLEQRYAILGDIALPEKARIGLDFIRDEQDLEIAIKFRLEVHYEGKSEEVWAAEHPREYERLQRIAGTVSVEGGSGQAKSTK
jgi:hypothetical protein